MPVSRDERQHRVAMEIDSITASDGDERMGWQW